MDEEKKEKYKSLINNLSVIVNTINNSKRNINALNGTTEQGIKINESNPEKEAVNFAKNAMDTAVNNLTSLISDMKSNLQ